jgi:hypothetical protein
MARVRGVVRVLIVAHVVGTSGVIAMARMGRMPAVTGMGSMEKGHPVPFMSRMRSTARMVPVAAVAGMGRVATVACMTRMVSA